MTKFLSALTLLAFAFSAQAASHAGAAPMKEAAPAASKPMKAAHSASAPMKAASAPMKK